MAMTRLAENSGLPLRAYFDCNPPSARHWSYVLFLQGKIPQEGTPVEDFDSEYAFLYMNPVDNLENLPEDYLKTLRALPRRQRERFLHGRFLTDVEGALWNMEMIDLCKAKPEPEVQIRTVVGVDPAITSEEQSALWGIVVGSIYHGEVEITEEKEIEHFQGYVHADYSVKLSPNEATKEVIRIYEQYDCDAVVVEVNQGGDMVSDLLRLNGFKGKLVKVRASRGKYARAEPVSALYEQGLIGHSEELAELEDELTTYTPFNSKKSPDRLDALVWMLTYLFLGKGQFAWDSLI